MKSLFVISIFLTISYSRAGVLPSSTTFIRQATSIAHSPTIRYSQPVAVAYSAPVTYSGSFAPVVYSQHLLAPAQYTSTVFAHHSPILAQQQIYAQYPGFIAQTPGIGQYPVAGAPSPVQSDPAQSPAQSPISAGEPIVAPADPQPPQNLPQQPAPQQPPQQSPILGAGSAGTTFDDDTVSVESA